MSLRRCRRFGLNGRLFLHPVGWRPFQAGQARFHLLPQFLKFPLPLGQLRAQGVVIRFQLADGGHS